LWSIVLVSWNKGEMKWFDSISQKVYYDHFLTQLKTLYLDILNLNIHCGHFWFLLIRSFSLFLDTPAEFWPMRVLSINGVQNFKFTGFLLAIRFLIRHSDWLNFRHFPGYKLKIKIILRLTKNLDQAVISISTIQKFSAQVN